MVCVIYHTEVIYLLCVLFQSKRARSGLSLLLSRRSEDVLDRSVVAEVLRSVHDGHPLLTQVRGGD
jgi:hypothetical protein